MTQCSTRGRQGPSQAKIIMNLRKVATVLASAMLYPWPSLAEPITEQPISAEVVLRQINSPRQTSWTGIDFQYPEGYCTHEITVLEITFQPRRRIRPPYQPNAWCSDRSDPTQGSLFCKLQHEPKTELNAPFNNFARACVSHLIQNQPPYLQKHWIDNHQSAGLLCRRARERLVLHRLQILTITSASKVKLQQTYNAEKGISHQFR